MTPTRDAGHGAAPPLVRVNDLIEGVLRGVGAGLFAVFIAVIFYQVVARNYLKISVVWTDEIALICFVWSVFLGAAVALRRRVHYEVEILPRHLVRLNTGLRLGASLAALLFIYVMIRYGWIYTTMGLRRTSTATGMPLAYVFAAIPASGLAMLIFSVETIAEDARAILVGKGRSHDDTAAAGGVDRP